MCILVIYDGRLCAYYMYLYSAKYIMHDEINHWGRQALTTYLYPATYMMEGISVIICILVNPCWKKLVAWELTNAKSMMEDI